VPDAPVNVAVQAFDPKDASDLSVSVSFEPGAYDGGSAVTNFTVTSEPGGKKAIGPASPIVLTGLTKGTSYKFTVTASNKIGMGKPSAVSDSVVPATTPDAPTNINVSAFDPTDAGDNSVTVSFDPPVNDGGIPVNLYTVTASPGGISETGTSSPITVTGLSSTAKYTFTVVAHNRIGAGVKSGSSAEVTPATVPAPPTEISAKVGNGSALVFFSPPAMAGGLAIDLYTVTTQDGITAHGKESPIMVKGLENGKAYTFTVRAHNAVGDSSSSLSTADVIPAGVPEVPTNVIATTTADGMLEVTFGPPMNDGGAPIDHFTAKTVPDGVLVHGEQSPIQVPFANLRPGVTYRVAVCAHNEAGNGPFSEPSGEVSTASPPGPPQRVTATANDYGIGTVTFDAPASDGGAAIQKYTVASTTGNLRASGAVSPINVSGLEAGTTYVFEVTATNSVGTGPPGVSAPASFHTQEEETVISSHESYEDRMKKIQTIVRMKLEGRIKYIVVDLINMRIYLNEMINFHAGTANIKEEDMEIVDELTLVCRTIHEVVREFNLPDIHLRVEGHVHKTKNIEKCWRLSNERADVIVQRVVAGGTPQESLHSKGFGPSRPLGSAEENRRVEVHVMSDEEVANAGKEDGSGAGGPPAPKHDLSQLANATLEQRLHKLQIAVLAKIGGKCPNLDINLEQRRIDLKEMINFRAGTAVIKEEDMNIVQELQFAVKVIHDTVVEANLPDLHLRVEGHVHKTKNIEKCWRLSNERAEVICQQIVAGGTPMAILHPKGFGPSMPLGSAEANRRVEVHIMTDEEVADLGKGN
jgi:outer membrane protein OmpA-like peptidoglycan-associated protein